MGFGPKISKTIWRSKRATPKLANTIVMCPATRFSFSNTSLCKSNAKAALRISDRGYVLAEGKNRIGGPAKELLEDPEIRKIFLGVRREKTNDRHKKRES